MSIGFIFDVGIVALAVISLLIGLFRGFAGHFGKGFCTFIGILLATATCFVVMSFADGTNAIDPLASLFNSFEEITTIWFAGDNGFGNFVASLSSITAIATASEPFGSVAGLFGNVTAHAIIDLVLWIVAFFLFKYVLLGITKLFKAIAKVPVFSTIDHIFGGIWGVLITYVVVISILYSAVVALFVKFGTAESQILVLIKQAVAESKVFSFVHEFNVLGHAWTQSLFGVDIIGFVAP